MLLKLKKVISLISALALTVSLPVGCGMTEIVDMIKEQSGKDIPADNWINSSIAGAVNENTPVSLKDDFYTAVNKDWILQQKLTDDQPYAIELARPQKVVDANKRKLLTDMDATGYLKNTGVGMDAEELENIGQIVSVFTSAVRDTAGRDAKGAAPLRPYLEAIERISGLDEMTDYILDFDGYNLVGAPFVSLSLGMTAEDAVNNLLIVKPIDGSDLALGERSAYSLITEKPLLREEVFSHVCSTVLEKLGYSKADIRSLLRKNYQFEARLAMGMSGSGDPLDEFYSQYAVHDKTLADMQQTVGDYPLLAIAKAYGYENSDLTVMYEDYFMSRLGRLYSERYLDEIKAYYIVHTVYECAPLLDSETSAYATEMRALIEPAVEDNELSESDRKLDAFMAQYVTPYIAAPFEMLYIAAYCTPEQKAAIREMLDDIEEQTANMIKGEEWLTKEGKTNCLEKLDFMAENVLYPDQYISFKGLKLTEDMSIPDMLRAIRINEKRKFAFKVNTPVDHGEWDLAEIPTTVVNAYNNLEVNAICILAGFIANGYTFDAAAPYEVNLARLGTVLGHEITHSFDSNGYRYDKYGSSGDLLSHDEKNVFTKSLFGLSTYYKAITPIPGEGPYVSGVTAEAIADMGGVKVALLTAAQQEDFDYDLFFRSYAELWRKVDRIEYERYYAANDSHPLAYLRTNVTLSQYDEFIVTYDLHPGDGMYVAKEDRITVW